MKIVIFCNSDPFHPHSGYQIPIYYRLKHYHFDECLVIINCQSDNLSEENKIFFNKEIKVIKADIFKPKNLFKSFLSFLLFKVPFFATKNVNIKTVNELDKKLQKFKPDVIYFEGHLFGTMHKYFKNYSYKIISINDSLALAYKEEFRNKINKNIFIRIFKKMNFSRILTYEKENYTKFDSCQVVSEYDATFLNKLNNNINVNVHNIGVDSNYFKAKSEIVINQETFLIVGNLVGGNYTYTKLFVKNVWVHFIKRNPSYKLKIVSRTIPNSTTSDYFKKLNIEILSNVNDLVSCYSGCFAVISPVLKSCGMQNKVLEGMSMSKPVIGFNESFYGINEGVNMKNYIGVDNFKHFVSVLQKIVDKEINLTKIKDSAHKMILDKYSWEELIMKQYSQNKFLFSKSNYVKNQNR